MRCKNCGWNNPDSAERCEKCNRPLVASVVSSSYTPQAVRPAAGPVDMNSRATRFDANMANSVAPQTVAPSYAPQAAAPAPMAPSPAAQSVADNKATRLYAANVESSEENAEPGNCPSCGYPLSPGSTVCPMCGTTIGANSAENAFKVELTCMDDDSHTVIEISSPNDLSLHTGDVILLGSLRYKVN